MPASQPPTFSVDVSKDSLVFSAAHFITIDDWCERLHGHNFRVGCTVEGPLDENGYVFDFIALRDKLQALCAQLDHRVLLPTAHPRIHVTCDEREATATFEDRRWVFPREDCVLLPIENTTAEQIAHWIGARLRETIRATATTALESLRIEVEENFGQWAVCELPL